MNPLEIYTYIKEKGYTCSKIRNSEGASKHGVYEVVVYNGPDPEQPPFRRTYVAHSITELFYAIQSEL